MKVGPTDDGSGVDMGPLVTRAHRDKVAAYLDVAVARAPSWPWTGGRSTCARRLSLGTERRGPRPAGDAPGPRGDLRPVLSVVRTGDLDEALALGRQCEYGNGASIFTRNGWAAREFKRRFNAGMIGINVGVPAPMAWFPFTGLEQVVFRRPAHAGRRRRPLLHATEDDAQSLVRLGEGVARRSDLEDASGQILTLGSHHMSVASLPVVSPQLRPAPTFPSLTTAAQARSARLRPSTDTRPHHLLPRPVLIVEGHMQYVWDERGTRYSTPSPAS